MFTRYMTTQTFNTFVSFDPTQDYQSRGKLDLVWPPPSPDEKVPQTGDTQVQYNSI